MEALADFGTVNLLGFRAFTDAIYRIWYGAFDRQGALQLAAMLLVLMLVMLALERASRRREGMSPAPGRARELPARRLRGPAAADRKSTRLNSSHANISYAVFFLKKNQYERARVCDEALTSRNTPADAEPDIRSEERSEPQFTQNPARLQQLVKESLYPPQYPSC